VKPDDETRPRWIHRSSSGVLGGGIQVKECIDEPGGLWRVECEVEHQYGRTAQQAKLELATALERLARSLRGA
jgi:hypothetical protein